MATNDITTATTGMVTFDKGAFVGVTPLEVTGIHAGNTALVSLLTRLAALGLITDSTTAE